ncbi:Zinc finger protein 862 [Dissostichus eleginoides]|uniref:Zinc finger protein 862 n=1 Tax=Dissostichus eleginoides TaxID=100907 RepID=A0AAD9CKL3_DISEL|nr:Zinc finger protein 862 [Dissostichus eleginoides]
MNLPFQTEDVNISSIQPVVNMTLASLEDLMNGPGEAETTFNEALQDGKLCGITLTQADAQTFSRVRTDYIAEVTKSIKKRFPSEHVGIIADLDTVNNASRYSRADSALKSYGLEALERVCDHYGERLF